jgi:hypothetical protein
MAVMLEGRIKAFRKKFGREPGPGDPIFFDPDADQPRIRSEAQQNSIWESICNKMLTVGCDPAIVYAARKTQRIVSQANRKNLTPAELAEWNDAIEEYQSCEGPIR